MAVRVPLVLLGALLEAWLGSRGSVGAELYSLVLLAAAVLAFTTSPNVFLGLSLVAIGTDSVSEAHPFAFGGAKIYSLDVLLVLVILRALLPRAHARPPAPLQGLTRVWVGAWALVMVAAGMRAAFDGYRLISIARLAVPLLYAIGFYFGLGRIVRERGFQLEKATKYLLVVVLGLVAYMAFARVTNTPFENEANPTIGHLGTVVTTSGVLRRDYGLASAFILYPVLGLAAAAYLLHTGRRTTLAAIVLAVGVIATLLTLIRGEIFGLFAGLTLIALLPNASYGPRVSRAAAIVAGVFVLVAGGVGLWVASPSTARGVTERSLPGLVHQSASAEENAKFRKNAVRAGLASAVRHPAGVGLVPDQEVTARSGVDVGYIAHSGLTATAAYTGWLGLITAALALLCVLRDSFVRPRAVPWLHPFFVGALVMMIFYTVFGAAGLVGQGWVTALAALIAALRFHAPEPTD